MSIQIDVKEITFNNFAKCNLYTDNRCVTIYMTESDYKELVRDGFFIRDGKTKDSANVLNTTEVYDFYPLK